MKIPRFNGRGDAITRKLAPICSMRGGIAETVFTEVSGKWFRRHPREFDSPEHGITVRYRWIPNGDPPRHTSLVKTRPSLLKDAFTAIKRLAVCSEFVQPGSLAISADSSRVKNNCHSRQIAKASISISRSSKAKPETRIDVAAGPGAG